MSEERSLMFLEKVRTEGLGHLSYLIGNGGKAAVIDPRRDCEEYIKLAESHQCRITHIFETHRNEDLISGAAVLSELTGATVYHGPNAAGDVAYAKTVKEGDSFRFGSVRMDVLETPGHTDDSLSFVIFDEDFGGDAVGVFTGDALFIGDVGRADFYPNRAKEVAGLLYDSLQKLVGLGDQAIIFPAHGAGSVCGNNMADREFSTIGYERLSNPMLRGQGRDKFIEQKLAEDHHQPPYFREMERLNLVGATEKRTPERPEALDLKSFNERKDDSVIVDVREVTAFLGGHVPGSYCLPEGMISAFAGWFLNTDDKILLVASDADQAKGAVRSLFRIGYDNVLGYLKAGVVGWAANAEPFEVIKAVDVDTVRTRLASDTKDWTLLDVRDQAEIEQGKIKGARTIYVGELQRKLDELEKSRHYTVMCASGARATVAASVLTRAGFSNVDVFLGSMGAWSSSQST